MFDTFIPLVPTAETGRSAFQASQLAASAAPASPPEPEPCSKPIVTLQRKGEIVSAIRIQCGCGQVLDLSCVY
ncbi:MAG TPA: hypothetical protein VFC44_13185 [Candidatus Saccharimonadales bacterium]|nr:hypothetical protein [Candidatus Saccharimonadales bacterium]